MKSSMFRFIPSLMIALTVNVAWALDTLPPLLETRAGDPITTPQQWEQRRPELLSLLSRHIYGVPTVGRPDDLNFQVIENNPNAMGGSATYRRVRIGFSGPGGNSAFDTHIYLPNNRTGPAPSFLFINNRSSSNLTRPGEFWSAQEQVNRGYAAVGFTVADVAPDVNNFNSGIHRIFDPFPADHRPDDAWGKIAAWSWGASRVMDYLETDPDIDAGRVGVVGHSRGGKASLWAGATDERFALTVSNNSGTAGAALSRGKTGEQIGDMNNGFPAWFVKNFKQYHGDTSRLPVDQHTLLAMMAPRLLYVASASNDSHAHPQNEFLASKLASPAWELYGLEGLLAEEYPAPNTAFHDGFIGYHLRQGNHGLTGYDWQQFMDFADLHWTTTTVVPEPAALGLLGLSMWLLVRRARPE